MSAHTTEEITSAIRTAVGAAVWAPSVHNTQPWSFSIDGEEIALRADSDRRLRLGDPEGREMLISCGAALMNVRLALRRFGREPQVRVLPDPDRPALLATVRVGAAVAPDEHTRLLHAEIERRRTHRAGFTEVPVADRLVEAFVCQASAEGARLTPVRSKAAVRVLAALTCAAEDVQSQDRLLTLEMIRWAQPPGSPRKDGVSAQGYPREPRRTHPHFAQRDYTHGHSWGSDTDQFLSTSTGTVAVLTTPGDSREDWVAAGQALQRILLHASAYDISAAFHTQALEMFHLREFLRQELLSGEYPQMIMRLGFTSDESEGVRRPVTDVLEERGPG
ncbi:nitroreductase family protein [Streptosporangium sp. NBC_01755]|uniref:Acg family FMN-binding oxidoreductase n=1 Tax=unclassified Streptosporangium TaxID=2632669 RepID=UPI002DDA581E|nr:MULTISPECIES: nitroreductase family protein [unclassified Streptosporangium]WSA28718.1 nitroreductase family protein [Streptosporangium sp. NBC_01810]WSC99829.1 nitroreductase family protein [Streptosporangium sp. NBC_01755]